MAPQTEPSTPPSEPKKEAVSFADLPSGKLEVNSISYRNEVIWQPSDGELKPDEVSKRMQSVRELKARPQKTSTPSP